ncbi:MAG TPA: hypothetical protein PK414_13870 [Anaerolineales bacterium]|nr:hypothetical protein [Anaerolineales bacterium]
MSAKKPLDTKLIVIDGLPGSGKSTTAQWLILQLQQQGIHAKWLQEDDTFHPLWWYEYWDGTDYQPPDFDNIQIETFIETSLVKWKNFVTQVDASDQRTIAESVFFQNAVAMFLMGGAKPASLAEYAHEVQRITRELNPILIYFYQIDESIALQKICSLRGRDFEDELLHNMENFPYLRQRNLKGLDGVTVLWKETRKLTDKLFDEYTISKLAIENSLGNWPHYYRQIIDFLGLPS